MGPPHFDLGPWAKTNTFRTIHLFRVQMRSFLKYRWTVWPYVCGWSLPLFRFRHANYSLQPCHRAVIGSLTVYEIVASLLVSEAIRHPPIYFSQVLALFYHFPSELCLSMFFLHGQKDMICFISLLEILFVLFIRLHKFDLSFYHSISKTN